MPTDKLSRYVKETRAYMESARGRAAWTENHFAHGYSYQKNLVAAIQTANPRARLIRIEDLEKIMAALGQRERVAA
jgi:hypothetical protein